MKFVGDEVAFQDDIAVEDRGDYLRVVVCGVANLEKVLTAIDEANKIFQEKPFTKILYDFRTMVGGISAIDRVRLGLYAARFRYYDLRVALLYRTEHIETLRFLETYLQDRGILFRIFSNETQALQWFVA